MGKRMGAAIREHLARRQERRRESKQICYEELGCFWKGGGPLSRTPQSPEELDTRFIVFRSGGGRGIRDEKGRMIWDEGGTASTPLDPSLRTTLIVHGYKGSSKDPGAKALVDSLLKKKEQNVILLDWEKGAKGPSYTLSAANTQLVGRQLANYIIEGILAAGIKPSDVHVIGFSLGAHIAGYAGRALKERGILLGRITGLDPASPLFRENLGSTLSALGREDAGFVDVLHTDGAAVWTSGFGLLKPLGDVDFFPNGGQEQPGCEQIRASVIVSRLEGTVNSSVVCNHARGFQLFLESASTSLESNERKTCRFMAFPCPTRESFLTGDCFPSRCNTSDGSCSVMGYDAENYPSRGALYLVTRDKPPFCGTQLQATIKVSDRMKRARGKVQMFLIHGKGEITEFNMVPEIRGNVILSGSSLRSLSASKHGVLIEGSPKENRGEPERDLEEVNETKSPVDDVIPLRTIETLLTFTPFRPNEEGRLFLDMIQLIDLDGNRWAYCKKETRLYDETGVDFDSARIQLVLGAC